MLEGASGSHVLGSRSASRRAARKARSGDGGEYARAEQAGEHRGRLLPDGDMPARRVRIHDYPGQMPIGAVEGQVHACRRDERGLARRPSREALENYLAGLGLKTRREVVHDYNSTPMRPSWLVHMSLLES